MLPTYKHILVYLTQVVYILITYLVYTSLALHKVLLSINYDNNDDNNVINLSIFTTNYNYNNYNYIDYLFNIIIYNDVIS